MVHIYSKQEKTLAINLVINGEKLSDIANQYQVSPRTIREWIKRARRPLNGDLTNQITRI